jgi:hypothetical protein
MAGQLPWVDSARGGDGAARLAEGIEQRQWSSGSDYRGSCHELFKLLERGREHLAPIRRCGRTEFRTRTSGAPVRPAVGSLGSEAQFGSEAGKAAAN